MKDSGSSIAIPTHFFKTILRCKDGEFLDTSCSGTLEAMPFVFGNFDWGLDSNTYQVSMSTSFSYYGISLFL